MTRKGQGKPRLKQRSQPATVDRILLSYSDLRELGIGYSRQHLWRLMTAGRFPRMVAFGPGQAARKAWRRDEVLSWIASLPVVRRQRRSGVRQSGPRVVKADARAKG
jgi:prophage regulatory protein